MYDKFDDRKYDNKQESSSDDTNLIVAKKHRKTIIIAALVLLGLLFVSLIVFSSRFYGMYYILHKMLQLSHPFPPYINNLWSSA